MKSPKNDHFSLPKEPSIIELGEFISDINEIREIRGLQNTRDICAIARISPLKNKEYQQKINYY